MLMFSFVFLLFCAVSVSLSFSLSVCVCAVGFFVCFLHGFYLFIFVPRIISEIYVELVEILHVQLVSCM